MPSSAPPPLLAPDSALFLDIDGTLLDFSIQPGAVRVPRALPGVLYGLRDRLGGALALISGRSLGDINVFFGPAIAAGAEHGAVLRGNDGKLISEIRPDPALEVLLAPLRAAVAACPGTFLEEKEFGLVLHWRGQPERGEELAARGRELAAPFPGLVLLPAQQALEIRTRGTDKGAALTSFMKLPPFAGRVPVFIGDDVTDEPAIARANDMGGRGLHVERDFGGTPHAVRQWLAASLEEGIAHAESA